MKRSVHLALALAILISGSMTLHAGSEDDAKVLWKKRYEKAVRDLQFGNSEEKLAAVMVLGGHRKAAYVRKLGDELLRDMTPEHQKYLRFPTNDPFVKTAIAWAIGRTEHKAGVPYLLQALDITTDLMKKDLEQRATSEKALVEFSEQNRKAEIADQNKLRQARGLPATDPEDKYKVVMVKPGYDFPGPLKTGKHAFPNSPDMHWSLAEDFRSMSYVDADPSHRMRMRGGNYMNMMRAIFWALGSIGSEEATESVKKYLTHEMPAVRAYAAQSLGMIGTSLSVEEAYAAEKNTRVKVYMTFAVLRNDKTKTTFYLDLVNKYIKDNNDLVRFDSAVVLRDLAMGESEQILRDALFIEDRPIIRSILEQGIYVTRRDNIMPVNY